MLCIFSSNSFACCIEGERSLISITGSNMHACCNLINMARTNFSMPIVQTKLTAESYLLTRKFGLTDFCNFMIQ